MAGDAADDVMNFGERRWWAGRANAAAEHNDLHCGDGDE
jgi:hypothetical protein